VAHVGPALSLPAVLSRRSLGEGGSLGEGWVARPSLDAPDIRDGLPDKRQPYNERAASGFPLDVKFPG